MIRSTALTSETHAAACRHLLRPDRQEDLCFALWAPSKGAERVSALVKELVLPKHGERRVHGNVSFESAYFERVLALALEKRLGVALMHSHLGPGWQGMSQDDVDAELRLAPRVKAATELPVVGMTLGTDGAWSSRFWEKAAPKRYERRWCESTRVVGERLAVTYHDEQRPVPRRPELVRTVSAWGEAAQARIARLKIGVIGAGSVGCVVAESLARMGIADVRLMDFDAVEVHNLDRLLHATRRDISIAKVQVLARRLRASATADPVNVSAFEYSVVEEAGFRAALDCDVLFSCVDRPWPRSVLNFIAYAHLIPVVDGGVAVRAKRSGTGLSHADMRAHVAAPTRRCLECLGQFDSGLVSTERDGYLDDPTYIAGLPDDHPIKRNENVFAFGMTAAALEVLQLLSMVIGPSGISNAGAQQYHFVNGRLDIEREPHCNECCVYPSLVSSGDRSGVNFTSRHEAAEQARAKRATIRFRLRRFWWRWLGGFRF